MSERGQDITANLAAPSDIHTQIKHAEAHLDVLRLRQMQHLRCVVLNTMSHESEIAAELALRYDVDLVCFFNVGQPPCSSVKCSLFSSGDIPANVVASVYGGGGSADAAAFEVPNLNHFQQLWIAERNDR